MQNPDEKKKLFELLVLVGIFALAGLIAYYNLLLRPQFSGFIVANREFGALKRSVNTGKSLIANEDRIRRQYEEIQKQAGLLEKKFPGQDEVSSLLEDFSNIAESSGIKILKIRPLEASDGVPEAGTGGKLYSRFPILIEARAGYHQFAMFIDKLENMERFIGIDGIDIKARSEEPRRHGIRLRVTTFLMQ
jgi:Tfp pilus assembly protein PilO